MIAVIDTFTIIGLVISAATLVGYGKWDISLSRDILQQWAVREGVEIIESKHRAVFRGPFTWNSQRNDAVFYVKVRTPAGVIRTGWVRFGKSAWAAEVQWDDK
jgi:hypothetical protein